MNVVAIIPARGGSKGIPGKNLRTVLGKPLIQYPIETAKQSKYINKIVISTDSIEIADFARSISVDSIMRPKELAEDSSLVIDAIRYTAEELSKNNYNSDLIILLEATSPLKSIEDIDLAIEMLINNKYDSAASFKEVHTSPGRLWKISNNEVNTFLDNAKPFLPRQQQPKAYELTGQFYVFTYDILLSNRDAISLLLGRVFPLISSTKYYFDIDNEEDLQIAEIFLQLDNKK